MKLLAIMGSPRKSGNSCKLTELVEQRLRACGDVTFDYLFLVDAHIERCTGCHTCFSQGEDKCPLKDDVPDIEKQMLDSDGVIFVTPVYVMSVTALMKNLIDRLAYVCHRPRFFHRHALVVATAPIGMAVKSTLDYLEWPPATWGFNTVHKLGVVTPGFPLAEESREKINRQIDTAARKFYRAIETKESPVPSAQALAGFRFRQWAFRTHADHGNCDHQYWKEKGWLDDNKQYFYDVRIGPLKSISASITCRLWRRFSSFS